MFFSWCRCSLVLELEPWQRWFLALKIVINMVANMKQTLVRSSFFNFHSMLLEIRRGKEWFFIHMRVNKEQKDKAEESQRDYTWRELVFLKELAFKRWFSQLCNFYDITLSNLYFTCFFHTFNKPSKLFQFIINDKIKDKNSKIKSILSVKVQKPRIYLQWLLLKTWLSSV